MEQVTQNDDWPADTSPVFSNQPVSVTSSDILRIADAQVFLCWAFLAELIGEMFVVIFPPVKLLLIAVLIGGAVAAFGSYRALFGLGWAIVLTIGSFFPCLGLFVLLGANATATNRLRAAGLTVGFMGVSAPQRTALREAIARDNIETATPPSPSRGPDIDA